MMQPQKSQMLSTGALLAVLLLLLGVSFPVWAVKPQPPLSLQIETTQQSNGKTQLRVRATAFMSLPKVELSVGLPESVSFVDGETKWDGPMAAGEEKTLLFVVHAISTLPGVVFAEGIATLPQGGSFTQHATLLMDKQAESSPSPSSPIRHKQGGRTILEFPGK